MSLVGKEKFDFNNLIIFDMANNHQGFVEHGLRIINEIGRVAQRNNIRAAIKFQFRDIDTFIHPDHKEGSDNKHIPRFISTRLTEDQYRILLAEIKRQNLLSICTPFDEPSVDIIERLGIEILKVASCSSQDWPLLERVAEAGKPVICSTGGLTIRQIDKIVSFFQHRGVHFALEHCVTIYPTPNEKFYINQIEIMRNRYPGVTIGFSTHEEPTNLRVVGLAYAKGARIFEKHVGVATDEITLNKYSGNPVQVEAWIKSLKDAIDICGHEKEREVTESEKTDLNSLMRGVFTKKELKAGTEIKRNDVFFAMPLSEGQLISGRWKDGLVADRDYKVNEPLNASLRVDNPTKADIIYSTVHAIKGMLNNAHIPIGHDFSVELSHHYGLKRFHEVGCVIIEVINREYAKKLIIQLHGQYNPVHYHKKKDETFQVLDGSLEVEIEGRKKTLYPGDTLWVPRGVWHDFGTEEGVIFEEISSTHQGEDSFYIDKSIAKMPREQRKTRLINWGRHQFDDSKE